MEIGSWIGLTALILTAGVVLREAFSRAKADRIAMLEEKVKSLESRAQRAEDKSEQCDINLEAANRRISSLTDRLIEEKVISRLKRAGTED